MNATNHRHQVGRKHQLGAGIDGLQYLADFRQVPVPGHPIGPDRFGGFAKRGIETGLAARPAATRLAVGNDRARINQTGAQQRQQGENHRGRITPGIGDQACTANRFAIQLRQAVNRIFE